MIDKKITDIKLDRYTPIMLCGEDTPLKSILETMISDHLMKEDPFSKIIRVTPAEINALHSKAISTKTETEFYKRFMDGDIIVIEDLHDLENYPNITNVFYCLINSLFHAKKSVLFTSRFLPFDIPGISSRLRSRLRWCKIIEVK